MSMDVWPQSLLLTIHLNKDSFALNTSAFADNLGRRLSASANDTSTIKSPLFPERRAVYGIAAIAPTHGLLSAQTSSRRETDCPELSGRTRRVSTVVDCYNCRLFPVVERVIGRFAWTRLRYHSVNARGAIRDRRAIICVVVATDPVTLIVVVVVVVESVSRTRKERAVSFARDISGTMRGWTRVHLDIVLDIRKGRDATARRRFGVNRAATKTSRSREFLNSKSFASRNFVQRVYRLQRISRLATNLCESRARHFACRMSEWDNFLSWSFNKNSNPSRARILRFPNGIKPG